jgi:general secretion pathway protein C
MRVRFPAVRALSLLLFALLCAIVAYWTIQLFGHRSPVAPAGAVARGQAPADLAQASRVFGGTVAATPAAAAALNIQVVGVVAAGKDGVALLSVDGRPAKPFHVGQQVADGINLAGVESTTVQLHDRGRTVELPAPARASVKVLTSGTNREPGAPSATAPPVAVAPPPYGAAAGQQRGAPPPIGAAAPGARMPQGFVPPPGFASPSGNAPQTGFATPGAALPGAVPVQAPGQQSPTTQAGGPTTPVSGMIGQGVPMEVNPPDTGAPPSQGQDGNAPAPARQ